MDSRPTFQRIESAVDVAKLTSSKAVIFGVGGSMTLLTALVRSGLGGIVAIDPDVVEQANVCRQGHHSVGMAKVDSAKEQLRRINPNLDFTGLAMRHDRMTIEQWQRVLAGVDLLIFATDSFECQAFGNRLALSMNTPALFIGLYEQARAGEIVWWTPEREDCYRCLLEYRYEKRRDAAAQTDPPSDGALLSDLQIVDGIGGQLALALLTQGSDNYFGGLIDQLGDRQFLQINLRHNFLIGNRDPVRAALGVPEANDVYFCWSTAARRNGPRLAPCPDCMELRGRTFDTEEDSTMDAPADSASGPASGTSDEVDDACQL
jgi:hypothetical protein